MRLSLVSIEKDGIIRVATDGNITAANLQAPAEHDEKNPPMKNPLESVLGVGWAGTRAMLDMSKTAYIDSSAIGWLIGTVRAFRESGGKLVIHSVQPAVRQVLQLLKIERVVPTASDELSARTLLTGGEQ